MRERSYGLLVERRDYSETSQIVTFFTPSFGLVRLLAKGAKRPKNPFQSALELMAYGEFLFIPKSGLSLLTEFYLEESFPRFRSSLYYYLLGNYLLEVIRRTVREGQPAGKFYQDALKLIFLLSQSSSRLPLLRFQLAAIDFLGVFPNINRCIFCGSNQFGRYTLFSHSQGGCVCSFCQKEVQNKQNYLEISYGKLRILESLSRMEPEALSGIFLDDRTLEQLICLSHSCLVSALERPLYSWKYLWEHMGSTFSPV